MKYVRPIIRLTLLVSFLLSFTTQGFTQESTAKKDTVSIIGTGDIMLGSNYPSEAKLPINDGKDLFREVKDILRDADVTFGNLEGCFLNKGGKAKPCKSGCYFFRMPDRYVNYLVDAGFDIANLANNHMNDFGPEGKTNTMKVLDDAGLKYAGLKDICEVSTFHKDGIKYGFCGFAPNTGTVKITDLAYAKKIVSELNETCDIVIASFHGGAEGKSHTRVTKKTETFYGENRGNVYEFAHAVVDAGADIVFGHGPHVVRAAELYKDRFIIYSMGNFCTAGDFSISGISGYAPIIKVYTDNKGKFLSGQITSAIQKDKTGPVLDANHSAAKEIKRLTNLDFPQTGLVISDEGLIERKEDNLVRMEKKWMLELEKTALIDNSKYNISETYLPVWLKKESTPEQEENTLAESIINFSQQFLGKPYRRGSKGPNSFDCSGFTSFIYKHFGLSLSPGCVTQVNQGTRVEKKELQTGDLIFFKGRNAKSSRVGHVGIVMSNENGNIKFIHACNRGVKIDKLEESTYYKPRYVTGLRVL